MASEVAYGANTFGSLAYYDQDTLSWKTYQLCLEGGLIEFSGTWPASGMMRSGKLFSRPTSGCLIVENESALLPTPTRSFGVNARGWGLSQTGRRRYSEQVESNALQFGYRPPINLLEWMMGFPENYTDLGPNPLATQLSQQPSNGLVGSSSNTIAKCGISLTKNSLQFARELTYEEWENVGDELFRVDQAWQWWVGDWINYGEKKYGQTYEQALALTDKSYGTVRNAATVAGEFALSRRRDISFSHHQAVQGLEADQQDTILDQAEREGKPRQWVRDRVKEIKGDASDAMAHDDGKGDVTKWLNLFLEITQRLDAIKLLIRNLQPHEIAFARGCIDDTKD